VVLRLLWGFRLVRYLVRRFMWRIRTKLLVSYLFIAVVPVVLLVLFFLLAGALLGGLVAGHMVSGEVQRAGDSLGALANAAMARLPLDDPRSRRCWARASSRRARSTRS